MCYAIVFKSVFIGNENILAKMLADIIGVSYEVFKDNIILKTNELSNDDYFMSEVDALKWVEWERRSMRNYDMKIGKKEGMEKGLEEGRAKGFKQGIAQGIEQGIERGIEQTSLNTVKSMLKENIDYDIISRVTGKSVKEIKK